MSSLSPLYDALNKTYEANKVSMDVEESQSAPVPDAVNKRESDDEKPGVPPKADKKQNANSGDPKGEDNTKKMKMDDNSPMGKSAEEAKAFVKDRVEYGVKIANDFMEKNMEAKKEALALEEEINKIASMDEEQLKEAGWDSFVEAGMNLGIGIVAGQAKIAMEMQQAEGGDPQVEQLVAVVAEGVAQEIADQLPEEQLADPAVQQEIDQTATAVATQAVEEALMEGEQEAAGMGGEGAPPAGGEGGAPPAAGGGGGGAPPREERGHVGYAD